MYAISRHVKISLLPIYMMRRFLSYHLLYSPSNVFIALEMTVKMHTADLLKRRGKEIARLPRIRSYNPNWTKHIRQMETEAAFSEEEHRERMSTWPGFLSDEQSATVSSAFWRSHCL